MILFVLKKKLFKSFIKTIKAHSEWNKEEFGKALVVFSGKFFTAFKETNGDLFESWNGIFMTIYTRDHSVFENPNLFEKGNLRSILLTKMVKTFSVFKGFGIVFFLWFPILEKIFKTLKKIGKSFEIWGREFFCSFAKSSGLGKGFFWNPLSFCEINNLLSQSFKVYAVFFGKRI